MLYGEINFEIDVNSEDGFHLLDMFLFQTDFFEDDSNEALLLNIVRSIDPNSIWGLRCLSRFDLDIDLNKYIFNLANRPARILSVREYMVGQIDVDLKDICEDRTYYSSLLKSGLLEDQQVRFDLISHFKNCDVERFFLEAQIVENDMRRKTLNIRGYKETANYLMKFAEFIELDSFLERMATHFVELENWRNYTEWNFVVMLKKLTKETDFAPSDKLKRELVDAALASESSSNAYMLLSSGLYDIDSELYVELHIFMLERALPSFSSNTDDEFVSWFEAANNYGRSQSRNESQSLPFPEFGM